MFLVYTPVLLVCAYFFAKNAKHCVPKPARRTMSRVVSEVVVTAAFTVARVSRFTAALRGAYVWEKRRQLCSGGAGRRVLARILDLFLGIDPKQARLDTSGGHESILILKAIATVEGRDYDITSVLDFLWSCGDGLRIDVPADVALGSTIGCRKDSRVTTRVAYRGHSNVAKRYSAQTFSARYECKTTDVFRFPPYASSEGIRRGLNVPRVLRTNFVGQNGRLLHGPEAGESSGLRRNFYADVDDDPSLQKNSISFFESHARPQETMALVVTTSQSKVFCNVL